MGPECFNATDLSAIGVLVPLTGTGDSTRWKALACAALLAVSQANARDGSVVPSFSQPPLLRSKLSAQLFDTKYTLHGGLEAFTAAQRARSAALVGPYRSTISTALASLGAYLHLPIVSYGSSSVVLSDDVRYPTFARTYPTDGDNAAVIIATLRGFGWNNLIILHVDDVWGATYADLIFARVVHCGLPEPRLISFMFKNDESARAAVRELSQQSANIVVLLAFGPDLPGIFNEALELGP